MELANGQVWHIMSTGELDSWLENLAAITELKTCEPNNHPKLIFARRDPTTMGQGRPKRDLELRIRELLPKSGWKPHDLKALVLWFHDEVGHVICEIGPETDATLNIIRMWLAFHSIYLRAQEFGGLPFHAALVDWRGIGVLLAAPAGTGKSTCCRRLVHPWKTLCDDETLVVKDSQGRYSAHPFPTWSDYLWGGSKQTWNVQQSFPLSAIFFLEQAESSKVAPIGHGRAATLINESAMEVCRRSWRNLHHDEVREQKKKLFDNACRLAKEISAFKLSVSLTGRFWEEMERAL
jgi:SynChlorMet cassette protein ScmC